MPHLISILVAGLLLLAFLLLTAYEARRGVRFFAGFRYKLDANVSRAGFLVEHIDWGAFTAHLTRTSLNTVAHDAAHGTLILVRSAERELTRAVSALRMRRESTPSFARKERETATLPAPARPIKDIVRHEHEN